MNETKLASLVTNTSEATYKDGKFFYISVPDDIEFNSKSSNYKDWGNWRKSNYHYFEKALKGIPKDSLVLDVGAGPSQFSELFKNFETVGIDFYPYPLVGIVSDINNPLPIQSNSFDVLILSNVLEHIYDTDALLSECYRVLKPGGKIIATIPFLMREHQQPYDFNRYTHFALQNKFEGFCNVEILPLGTPFEVYNSIQRQFWLHYAPKNFITSFFFIVERILFKISKKLIKGVSPSETFTEGYGISGYKK